MSVFVTKSSMPEWEEYIAEIRPIFETHQMTNMGPVYKKLQNDLKNYLSVPEILMFVNGHLALEVAIQAMDFPVGSEVITTPYTFVSTTHAIARNGLTPVFCDIEPEHYTIDPEKLEALITDKTVAIVPVHVYGDMCDTDTIEALAKKHNLKVIYDAAHAFGVTYNGVSAGNYGDASMFSFHATKVFNTIEGGAIVYSDTELGERMRELMNFGIHDETGINLLGTNAKLDEFRAAMGICNLRHVDHEIQKRKKVFERYNSHLTGVIGIKTIRYREGVVPNYAYYPILIDENKLKKTRDMLYDMLKEQDIYARKYFYPAINDTSCYQSTSYKSQTPIAKYVSEHILCLPMYADLRMEDVDRICNIILG